jgi:hypothetical protein
VALTPNGIRLPNKRRKKLSQIRNNFDAETDPRLKVKLGERLLGCVTEAAQIEPQFKTQIAPAAENLSKARQALNSWD